MGKNTKISWAHHTFNPWVGCTPVGPGCDHCYAETWAKRSGDPDLWNGKRRRTKTWGDPRKWNREAEALGIRYRVFPSLCDPFDNAVYAEWRDDLWALIRETPHLDWILLTKRVGNVPGMLPEDWGDGWANVWLCITVVTQAEADRDIPKLLDIPAVVHGLSIEPQLERITVAEWLPGPYMLGVRWVITGEESGHHRRPYETDWARSLRDECQTAREAFFYKQRIIDGRKVENPELDGQVWAEIPRASYSLISGSEDQ